jgi:hypothetical protein
MRNPWRQPEKAFRPAPADETLEAARARRLVELRKDIDRAKSELELLDETLSGVRFKMFKARLGVPMALTEEEFRLRVSYSEAEMRLSKLLAEHAALREPNEQVSFGGKVISHA